MGGDRYTFRNFVIAHAAACQRVEFEVTRHAKVCANRQLSSPHQRRIAKHAAKQEAELLRNLEMRAAGMLPLESIPPFVLKTLGEKSVSLDVASIREELAPQIVKLGLRLETWLDHQTPFTTGLVECGIRSVGRRISGKEDAIFRSLQPTSFIPDSAGELSGVTPSWLNLQ